MGSFTQLVSYKLNRENNSTASVFFVQHSSSTVRYEKRGGGLLDQELVITGDLYRRQYKADMRFDNFPECGSEREAALRLASWMQRMGAAIEEYWSER
ncbi:TPA: hypothetical protein ACPZT9_000356 [Yersinia enterocolitica]